MTSAEPGSPAWTDAYLVAALFAIDPTGLGGIVVRGPPGPARDGWTSMARSLLAPDAPVRRIPANIGDDRLLGGLDLAASLAARKPIVQRGVLAESDGGVVILPMAERIDAATAAKICAALDQGEVALERDGLASRQSARFGVIAFDEGLGADEQPPAALLDRVAFHLDLAAFGCREPLSQGPGPREVEQARCCVDQVAPAETPIIEALCAISQRLGVESARPALLALRAARAHAALQGRREIIAEDAAAAARLVLGPRASTCPDETQESAEPRAVDEAVPPADTELESRSEQPEEAKAQDGTEMVIAAIQAALPDDLISRMAMDRQVRAPAARAVGAGDRSTSASRGRPVGSRSGPLRAGARLNLIDTLRAALPWQALRDRGSAEWRIEVRASDFRIRRYVQRRNSTTIFVVDASGSTAFQRLAEAKGAVELLLAKAYVTRSHVALISFRGACAETLLPPTRSLARAKARLADLPGGGGTPMAAGMDSALTLALAERARGRSPLMVLLTDGRANIGRDGAPSRASAESDAVASARQIQEAGIAAVFVDTSPRPAPDADRFARAMGATYAPLPYLDAAAVLEVVGEQRALGR